MHRTFSSELLKSIEDQIQQCLIASGKLDVFKSAETIRRENLGDNVAFEDIVDRLAINVRLRCVLEFLPESEMAVSTSQVRDIPLQRRCLSNERGKYGVQ